MITLSRTAAILTLLILVMLGACSDGGGSSTPAQAGAAITAQPSDQSVVAGTTATFNVVASDTTGYQWQKSTDSGTSFSDVSGAISADYMTPATTLADSGTKYRVMVTGANNNVTSSAVTLTVTAIVVAPGISVHPANQTITAGQNASFSVTASGTSLAYQWQRSSDGGTSFTELAAETNATLTLTAALLADNAKQFRVVVSNSAGSITSNPAVLTVNPALIIPAFTTQPSSLIVVAPNTATFSVAVTGTPNPALQWQISTNAGSSFTDIAGATGASYTTPATVIGDSGKQFRVIATNTTATVASAVATLTVNPPTPPVFTTLPANVAVSVGQNAQFTVTASGAPTPTLQWQLSIDSGATWNNINGETASVLTVSNATLGINGRQFRAVASNSAGTASSSAATLLVNAVAVPRFAYATNNGDNTVSIYTVNAATGQLRHNGYIGSGTTPLSVAVDPSGRFAYTANYGSNSVSVYTINQSTGVLTAGASVAAGLWPYAVTVDPSGRFAYVANEASHTISAYTINQSSGALTSVGTAAAVQNPKSIVVDPTGKFAYAANYFGDNVSVYTINQSTGALNVGTPVAAGTNPNAVTVDPAGKFVYVANYGAASISAYTINATTGVLTAVSGSPFGAETNPYSVTVDPTGKFAYVANAGAGTVSAYTINAATGALSSAGTVSAGSSPRNVSVDPSGKFAYVANYGTNDVSVYSIHATTGALTPLRTVTGRSGTAAIAMSKGAVAVSYTPKFSYVTNTMGGNTTGSVSAFGIDSGTGALSAVGGSPFASGWNTQSLSTNPAGTFAYVANYNPTLSGFSIAANGSLSTLAGSPYAAPASQSAWASAVDPSGRFVYYANFNNGGAGSVSAFSINPTTGALTAIAGSAFAAGNGPRDIVIDPSGRFVYVVNTLGNTVSGYSIDAVSGVLTRIDADSAVAGVQDFAAGSGPNIITVDPSGHFVYVTNDVDSTVSVYTINATSGALLPVDADANTAGVQNFPVTRAFAVAIEPTGRFAYFTSTGGFNSVGVYAINATTGAITSTGSSAATGAYPYAMTIDASGSYAYVANYGANSVSAYRIDAATGALTEVTGSPYVTTGATGAVSVITTGTIQ